MIPDFRLTTDEKSPVSFSALLGAEAPKVSGGGGWTVIARPRRQGIVDWTGNEPIRLSISFMLDNWAAGEGVLIEKQIKNLEKMAGIGTGSAPPPLLKLYSGGVVPYDAKTHDGLRWVVEGIDWGDALRNREGNRVRQMGLITLLRFVADSRLEKLKPVPKARGRGRGGRARGGRSGRSSYTVKRGDTLVKIAARVLKDANRWREIAKLNGIRDPNNVKVGKVLKMP